MNYTTLLCQNKYFSIGFDRKSANSRRGVLLLLFTAGWVSCYNMENKRRKGDFGTMAEDYLLPGNVIAMPREAARRLLKDGGGDGALLYLCCLCGDEPSSLGWEPARLQAAWGRLVALNLADPAQPVTAPPATPPEPEGPPDYSSRDVAMALAGETSFPCLVSELQKRLGEMLSPSNLQTLLVLYDYLGLPAEVILLIASWCTEETERKYGPGRRPTLTFIKKTAFQWHRQGVDTLEAAEEHLRRLTLRQEGAGHILSLLGIYGRAPIASELKYLEPWAEMGFEDDVIRLAYEKTVLKKQEMNWPYMNSILKNWSRAGLHTRQEVLDKDQNRWRKPTAPAGTAGPGSAGPGRQSQRQEDMDWMEDFLKQNGQGKEE